MHVSKVYVQKLKIYTGAGEVLFPTLRFQGKYTLRLDAGISGSPKEYWLHSCRGGAVTTKVGNSCDEHMVQKQMRLASVDTVHCYATLGKKMLAKATEKLFSM